MARPSRGASRSLDAPLVCVPSPAPVLLDQSGGTIGADAYDTGLPDATTVAVKVYQNGSFFDSDPTTALNLREGGWSYDTPGIDAWTVQFDLARGGSFCPGLTPLSNEINFG